MKTIEYADLAEKVYRSLKDMILEGEILPGEKLRQEELAGKLGVSRTPLAAAFSKLEKEMLVELLPRRGARARVLDRKHLLDLYEIRVRLESFGAREAAINATVADLRRLDESLLRNRAIMTEGNPKAIRLADYEFHLAVAEISRNEALYRIISSFNVVFICNLRGLLKPAGTSLAEHEVLVEAIRAHDGLKAERIMTEHLVDSRDRLESMSEMEKT